MDLAEIFFVTCQIVPISKWPQKNKKKSVKNGQNCDVATGFERF